MPRFLGICFLATFLFGFAACEKPDINKDPIEQIDSTEAKIKLTTTKDKLHLDAAEGSTINIIFSCDHVWKIVVPEDASWLTFDKTEGDAG